MTVCRLLCSKVTAAIAGHFLIQIKHRLGGDRTVPGTGPGPRRLCPAWTGLVHALLPIKTLMLNGY
jgi:hypothetical protein